MDSAYFERALFTLGNRVDVSVRARFFTGGTRRAIELRDRICTHPHCYEPAENCQVDHIQTYASGGETTQDNGRLLCGFHNRLRNQHEHHRPTSASGHRRAQPDGAAPSRPSPPRQHPGSMHGRHFEKRQHPGALARPPTRSGGASARRRQRAPRQDKCVCGRSSSTPSRNRSIFSL